MTITIPLTELRPQLPKIMDRISKYFDRCVITRHGKPEAVILSEEDYENLLETLDILSDRKLVKEIKKAEMELKKGKGIPWEKLKKKLGHV
ncbi:MAG: type II toxin-antitoxin system Phd/YefM family antitoxin [Candidatus Omnitrophota bacterium]